jgi:DNA repair protein RadC
VKELSAEILNTYSIGSIADRSMKDLKKFEGVSRVKAGQLIAVSELSRRMQREKRERLDNLADVKTRVADMKFLETEILRVFYLNAGNELLAEKSFDGGVGFVNIDSRQIVLEALSSNASAVILAHNHPSGKSKPTPADVQATKDLQRLCGKLDVELLDHIIVGEEVSSMRRSGSLG